MLNSTDPDFDQKLEDLSNQLKANVALECVSGEDTGKLLQALQVGGVCINYGMLSEKKIGPINPIVFIFKAQRLETFLLPYWLNSKGIFGKLGALRQAAQFVEGIKISKCFGFHQIEEAISYYKENMTQGKVFLKPELTE